MQRAIPALDEAVEMHSLLMTGEDDVLNAQYTTDLLLDQYVSDLRLHFVTT